MIGGSTKADGERGGARSCVARLSGLLVVLSIAATVPANADVPVPKISKGKGDKCVEETPFMRRNHMELILHQRVKTVHDGIRTKKYSLKECLNCHAVNDAQGKPVAYTDPRHFCTACHSYASVNIDCFECHSSMPEPQASTTPP